MIIDVNILIAWGAIYKKLKPKEILFSEGEPGFHYYQLVSGSIRWINIDDEGKEYIQYIVEPGECFGELPLIDDAPYAATSIAESDSVILKLNKEHFLQLLKENPEIHFAFTKMLVKRIRYKFLLTKAIAYLNPENRLMTLLNYLKTEKKHVCPKCAQIKLTRQQIADMTGLRVETVIRSMKNLHEKNYLRIERGKIYL
jgi:CRP/FNR family cyclic AMP-dependent transcriptional regulator